MDHYDGKAERREFRLWGMSGIVLIIVAVVLLSVLGFVLNSLGLIGKTIVEREVFERSHQYCQARKSQVTTYEASLAELEGRLLNANLSDAQRTGTEAQQSAINIKLKSEKANMEGC